MESEMKRNRIDAETFWPSAFFMLNASALVMWFYLSGFFMPLEPRQEYRLPTDRHSDELVVDNIYITFNSSLDPSSVPEDAIRLIPPVAGKTELVNGRFLRYQPLEKLQPRTGYRITWSPELRPKTPTGPDESPGRYRNG